MVIDEPSFYLLGGQEATRDMLSELLRERVSHRRAAGAVVATTQTTSHDVLPTWIRDFLAFRLVNQTVGKRKSGRMVGS